MTARNPDRIAGASEPEVRRRTLSWPYRFAPSHWLPSLAILVLGFALASLHVWLKSLHLILALHLSFYFLFA